MKVTIPVWKSYKVCEVWEITEMKDGYVYKTKSTGKYVLEGTKLSDTYILSSVSTSLTRNGDNITIDLVDSTYFGRKAK